MGRLHFSQNIGKLEKRKGGYFYLKITRETVESFEKKRATRLICVLENEVKIACGLNHLGDGNFFIIIAGKHMKTLGMEEGSLVSFEIYEDPNPLGVEEPETLLILVEQDPVMKTIYDRLTDGRKRSLIFATRTIKDVDKQIKAMVDFLMEEDRKWKKKNT